MQDVPVIRVLTADDQVFVHEAVRLLCRVEPRIDVVGTLTQADRVRETAGRLGADVVLLDYDMPGGDPLAVAEEMHTSGDHARVILYTAFCNASIVLRAVDAGVWGYISKDDPPEHVVNAIRRVAAGEVYFSDTPQRMLV